MIGSAGYGFVIVQRYLDHFSVFLSDLYIADRCDSNMTIVADRVAVVLFSLFLFFEQFLKFKIPAVKQSYPSIRRKTTAGGLSLNDENFGFRRIL